VKKVGGEFHVWLGELEWDYPSFEGGGCQEKKSSSQGTTSSPAGMLVLGTCWKQGMSLLIPTQDEGEKRQGLQRPFNM